MNIINAINALNHKVEVMAREIGRADVNSDGLLSKSEAGAAITGLAGGKGALDVNDLNNATRGGVYYLPGDRSYENVPFTVTGGNYRMQLEVIRNYQSDPYTNDPLVFQKVTTIEANSVKRATRFYYSGWGSENAWSSWNYDAGSVLWTGSQNTDGSTITVKQDLRAYDHIKIVWQPYMNNLKDFIVTVSTIPSFSDVAVNAPNTGGDNPAISIEELNIMISSDFMSLTPKSVFYYVQNGVTYNAANSGKSRLISVIGYQNK